ncbi:c-type cytochrome [Phenylobacterium montanum]|uniref:Cytochrome c family protein n=1 Tax=Phenylobacterium montanum TaxID=2823693 RepID=A0A975FYR2_9CAUL|nr:cytochrome c family protein [Caulobacter sp. S6]QUD87928.1 cytochrome c family protein [Caulobacter sp. S6]
MRRSPAVLVFAAVALLGACNKQQAASSAPEQAAAPAATPSEPTPEQAKAILATLPAAYQNADLENGKHKFAQCAACHTATQGGPNMTGPNLYGVFGRKAGSKADYDYSDGMKAQSFTWDADHVNTWITDPRAMIANTKMTFAGLKDPKDRADLIGYLAVQTTPAK